MSDRDIRALKAVLFIIVTVAVVVLVSGYVGDQTAAQDQAIEQLDR